MKFEVLRLSEREQELIAFRRKLAQSCVQATTIPTRLFTPRHATNWNFGEEMRGLFFRNKAAR